MPKIYLLLPTYNESENLPPLVASIFDLKVPNLRVVVIDDNSPDGTGQIADELVARYPMQVVHREVKLGLGSAYIAGFKLALREGADLIFEMDADFSHDPRDIPRFIQASQEGADVVVGSRRVEGGKIIGWNLRRHLTSWGAMSFARLVLGLKTKDVTSGFRCFKRQVLEKIDLDKIKSNGYAFQEEMIYKCEKTGFIVKEIPIIFKDRERGQSKLSWREMAEFFAVMVKLRVSG